MPVSVIIPTLNESKAIVRTLTDLLAQQPGEILVVDGRSTDTTAALAAEYATLLQAEPGRARQMNVGAWNAQGDILLFLHADTRLPAHGLRTIELAVARGVEAGRFQARFDDPHWLMRLYGWMTRFHALSMGDQAFFVRRDRFLGMGGYRVDVPFEDIDFYSRLRRLTTPVILDTAVVTSARRFQRHGRVRQQLLNVLLLTWHYLGGDVRWLKARLYRPVR